MHTKGRVFTGISAGKWYDRLTPLIGLGKQFYANALGALKLHENQKALDLGCGTGALIFALAEQSPLNVELHGVDLSEQQIDQARKKSKHYTQPMHFTVQSIDEVNYPDESFEIVMTSMALHAVNSTLHDSAIGNAVRILKPMGHFLLVDIAKPRFSISGALLYLPLRLSKSHRNNWNNTLKKMCLQHGLTPIEDNYISPFVRRQLFQKIDCTK